MNGLLSMGSDRPDTVSNIYLTVSSELIYGEGEEMSTTPCYDEVCQNSSQWNYISGRFNGNGNHDNNDANGCSNYYNNANIYESLRKKKECYLHDLINNAAFTTPCQRSSSTKNQKLQQILETEICKNKGKLCFVILLVVVILNTSALIYICAQNISSSTVIENKENYSSGNSSKERFPVYYYEKPWYKTDTGPYADGCTKKNYKTLSCIKIEKIKRSCDKIPECVKEIKKMAISPDDKKFNFIVDQESNVYKGLNWQCTIVSDTLSIGYFDDNDDCTDGMTLLKFFVHVPEVLKYGKIYGMLKPILSVTSDCKISDLMDALFKTIDL